MACEAIASASPRMETLIFGPGDYSASIGIPLTTIGAAPDGYPGDHLNYVYSRLVVAARAAGIQAIDGPYARVGDDDGLRSRSQFARALGLDGKWTIHPGQIPIVNEVFCPGPLAVGTRRAMLSAYDEAHRYGAGAALRGRDDRRGQPQDGRADRARGPRGGVRAMSRGARAACSLSPWSSSSWPSWLLRRARDDPRPPRTRRRRRRPDRHADSDRHAAEETTRRRRPPTPQADRRPGPAPHRQRVRKPRFDKGETVRFRVRSPADDHVHIHGYDIMKDVKAGQMTRTASRRRSTASSRSSSRTPAADRRLRVDP